MKGSKIIATPGSWQSNIAACHVAEGASRLADIRCHSESIYWLESVAEENGRMAIMRYQDDSPENILPLPFNVRSKVHEYGGAPYCVSDAGIFFINANDQGLYQITFDNNGAQTSEHTTVKPELVAIKEATRFGDLIWHEASHCIIAVAETQRGDHEVENTLVTIALDGTIEPLFTTGSDAGLDQFYAYPRLNANGSKLCWINWSHPNMPWDKTELYIADIHQSETKQHLRSNLSTKLKLNKICKVSALNVPNDESIVQPYWLADDRLMYVSDRTNWWNIYIYDPATLDAHIDHDQEHKQTRATPTHFAHNAEYATPLWVLGMQNYAVLGNTLFASFTQNGEWFIRRINIKTGEYTTLPDMFSSIESIHSIESTQSGTDQVLFIASTPHSFSAVYQLDPHSLEYTQISDRKSIDGAEISSPKPIQANGVHAFYYPAHNSKYDSDVPSPLIVLCHGGPTGQTTSELNYKIQYWCNRGFSVVDINYRGSTGFGRAYRQSLYGKWGQYDVEDMVAAVDYLIEQGWVDAEKVIIKGSSAGGYTVLAALAFSQRFNVGVSLYGVGDLELLAADTHKFEKHYLDQLIGPYPEYKAQYRQRSPVHALDNINCPILLFQGLEDMIVPPNQARTMAQRVRDKNLPVALVEYGDEGHGFRSPKNIEHMLNAELYFYQRIFGLDVTAKKPPITIDNLAT